MRVKRLVVYLLCAILVVLSGCSSNKTTKEVKTQPSEEKEISMNYTNTPTMFLHGAGGGRSSMKGMINRFEEKGVAKKALVINVSTTGDVSVEKDLPTSHFEKDNPMIQVIFEDNRNNEWEQAKWIKSVLEFLQEKYDVKQVNIVGHSMGGISGLRYLLQDGSNQDLPKVEKLVALGSPYNEFIDTLNQQTLDELLTSGPTEKSERYLLYEQEIANMPKDVSFLLVGGKISDDDLSDKIVPLSSAFAVKSLLTQHENHVEYMLVEGNGAEHSALHEHEGVDEAVSDFLSYKK